MLMAGKGGRWRGKPVAEWSVEDTVEWLGEEKLGKYAAAFEALDVDGFLLPELTDDVLQEELQALPLPVVLTLTLALCRWMLSCTASRSSS